jgi:predicted transcriptional regulator
MPDIEDAKIGAIELAADLTMAWLSNPNTRASADDVPAFLKTIHDAVSGLTSSPVEDTPEEAAEPEFTRAVSVRRSLGSKDHIISMIDGKSYRTLRRHLSTNGLTPKEYIERYNLPKDYPMVAPSYSEARRAMAKKIGLGRKPGQKMPAKAASAAGASVASKGPAKRVRKAPA